MEYLTIAQETVTCILRISRNCATEAVIKSKLGFESDS